MFCQSFVFAQTDTSLILGKIQYSFAILDSTKIPSHILLDRTLAFGHANYYSGNGDSICTIKRYKQLYFDMQNAAYVSYWQLPLLDSLETRASAYLDNGIHPISLSRFDFHCIKPEALDSGWLLFDTVVQQYKESTNNGISPFERKTLFVGAIFNPVTWKGITKFKLAPDLLFSNVLNNSVEVSIDFGDGFGYRNVGFDEVITINYTGFEEGSIGIIKIKAKFNGGETLFTTTVFRFAKTGDDITPDGTIEVQENFRNTFNVCGINNGLQSGDARFYIQYANLYDSKLRKPIIIVEGFDIDKNANDNRYGDLGWTTFKTGITYNEDGEQTAFQLENLPVLMGRLKAEGYDVIVVDFKDGGKRIESNALALISIIQWVNLKKEGSNELSVMGASMGGLIVRYALRLMEEQNCKHCTRIYITYDSPHRGANIPVGVQHFVKFFAQVDADAKDQYDKTLSSDAALQMLVYHVNPLAATYRNPWQNLLNKMGHPQKPYKVSLINGASNGKGLNFTAGDQVLQYHANKWIVEIMGNVWSVPNNPNAVSGQIIFAGKAPKNGAWSAIANLTLNPFLSLFGMHVDHHTTTEVLGFSTLPYDNAAGGTTETFKDIADVDYPVGKVSALVGDYHCFIPSVSAMDLHTNDLNLDITQEIAKKSKVTPFEAYYFPDIEDNKPNQRHVEVTIGIRGNIEWLIKQLKENEPIVNISILPNNSGLNFNYALAHKKDVKGNIIINNGGALYFNKHAKVNYATAADELAIKATTRYFQTSGCEISQLTVNEGGKIIVGDIGPTPINNKGIVTVSAGSALILNSGSQFIIHKGSKVIIEEGASIIFNQGATIQIAETGILEIRGRLFIGDNAVFSFDGVTGQGKGFIRWVNNENLHDRSSQINPGINSKISFSGLPVGFNAYSKVLEIIGSGGLIMQQHIKPYLFECINGIIELHSSTSIITSNSISLTNVTIQKMIGAPTKAGGLYIVEENYASTPLQSIINITGCSMNDCEKGVSIIMANNPITVTLVNNRFNRCVTGLYTNGISASVSLTNFSFCNYGWEVSNPNGITLGSEISTNASGSAGIMILNSATSIVKLERHNSTNDYIGCLVNNGELRIKCMNAVNPFKAAIYSNGGKVVLNGVDGGFNSITNSIDQAIVLNNQSSLNIKDGYNHITKSSMNYNWYPIAEDGYNAASLSCSQIFYSPHPLGSFMEAIDISGNFIQLPHSSSYRRLCGTVNQYGGFYNNNTSSTATIISLINNTCNTGTVTIGGGGSFNKKATNPDPQPTNEEQYETQQLISEIVVFPNPAKQQLQIQTNSNKANYHVEIFDSFGKKVYEGIIVNGLNSINIEKLKTGIYSINIGCQKKLNKYKILIEND
jgi:hypothetical protein